MQFSVYVSGIAFVGEEERLLFRFVQSDSIGNGRMIPQALRKGNIIVVYGVGVRAISNALRADDAAFDPRISESVNPTAVGRSEEFDVGFADGSRVISSRAKEQLTAHKGDNCAHNLAARTSRRTCRGSCA